MEVTQSHPTSLCNDYIESITRTEDGTAARITKTKSPRIIHTEYAGRA